jgi:chromosome partitioning protein
LGTAFERSNLQRVVAVINNKGGVGKTTLCANIGGILANAGWRVLIIDLDPQGNLGLDLGYHGTELDDDGAGLSKALLFGETLAPVKSIRPNLDVVPGGRLVNHIARSLGQQMGESGNASAQTRLSLASSLAPIGEDYDVVLLDCPPNTDVIQTLAVAAARYILIPTKADTASLQGLTLTAERLEQVIDINPDVDLLGVIIFASGASATSVRGGFADSVVAELGGEAARGKVFENYVRHAEAVAMAAREKRMLVHELDAKVKTGEKWYEAIKQGKKHEAPGPQSSGTVADSLVAVTQEFIARLTQKEEQAVSATETKANAHV